MSHITQGRPGLELEEGPGSCSSPAPGSPGPVGYMGRAKTHTEIPPRFLMESAGISLHILLRGLETSWVGKGIKKQWDQNRQIHRD